MRAQSPETRYWSHARADPEAAQCRASPAWMLVLCNRTSTQLSGSSDKPVSGPQLQSVVLVLLSSDSGLFLAGPRRSTPLPRQWSGSTTASIEVTNSKEVVTFTFPGVCDRKALFR